MITSFGFGLQAAERVLSFNEWKERQVVSAMNRQVRAANQLRVLRLNSKVIDRSQERVLISELIRLGSAVETTKSLDLEDYFLVYLKPLGPDHASLRAAARRLSPNQVEELIRLMIRDKEVLDRRTGMTTPWKATSRNRQRL